MTTSLRVLIVEDSENDSELILRALRKGGFTPDWQRVETPEDLGDALNGGIWDVVISDFSMPRFTASEALEIVHDSGHDLPFLVVSGAIGEETAVEAMKAGAHDYLMKDNLTRLAPAIKRELREAEERRARRIAEQNLWHQAYHDLLTGLPNRALFMDRMTQAIAYQRRDGKSLALLFLDLDRFKYVNDTLGHFIGDDLLRSVARRLMNSVREEDTLARLGGDEFGLLLTRVSNPQVVTEKAKKLVNALELPFVIKGKELHIGVSIGVALYPVDAAEPEALLRNADAAMYQAKSRGGNGYYFFNRDIDVARSRQFELENKLRHAIREQKFQLYYQPQINLSTGEITGAEALLRWDDPELGAIPPSQFIPLAEETGLIAPLGRWVIEQACRDYCKCKEQGCAPPRLAINLSAKQLYLQELLQTVHQSVTENNLNSGILEFEMTESAIMQDPARAIENVHALKGMGIRIAIDDFGTGYSSLSYLKHFPIDVLKIDRSFVHDIPADSDNTAIVTAIVAMAHSLKLKVIAEGVETEAQRAFLCNQRCEEMQGFLFSRPLPLPQLEFLLQAASSEQRNTKQNNA
jgi:diguanylate cyclase (GGDEF)-like protein